MKSLEIVNTLNTSNKYWTLSWYFYECYAFYTHYALYSQNSIPLTLLFTELVLCLHPLRRTTRSTSIVHIFLICSVKSTRFNWINLLFYFGWHILKWDSRAEIPGTFTFSDLPACRATKYLKKSRSSLSQDPAINDRQTTFT